MVRHPVRAEDLLFPLPGVDPVLRQEEGLSGPDVGHGSEHARVARGDGVVQVRLRDLAAEQIEQGQEHGADAVEIIGEAHVGEILGGELLDQFQKRLAHEKADVFHGGAGEKAEHRLPVRAVAAEQFEESFPLPVAHRAPSGLFQVDGHHLVEVDVLQFDHVFRHFVGVLSPVFLLSPDGPDHELVLRHGLDEAVEPAGHTACHKGIASLADHADSHGAASHSSRITGSVQRSQKHPDASYSSAPVTRAGLSAERQSHASS